VRVREVG
jgi:predicted hydrolase (HD superfamily)